MATGKVFSLVNKLGKELGSAGLRRNSWNARDLIASHLGEDPDALQVAEPLERLIRSCNEEAELSTIGRIAVHRHIVELLGNLSRLMAAWERAPAGDRIERPVVITGLPRTGSTLLHTLMAQDPAVRVPRSWEVMRPPTGPGQDRANRRYCEFRLGWARRLVPDFRHIHPLGATLPEECIAITAYAFRSIVFHTTEHVPAYQDWLEQTDHRIAYRFHRRFLQHLQQFAGGRRWVLKAPGHMFAIDALVDAYPDALIVQTHRDPLRVAASLASHTSVLRSAFSDHYDRREIASDWLPRWWSALDDFLDFRDRRDIAVVDVFYDDLVSKPLDTMASLYSALGWELPAQVRDRMRSWLAASANGAHTKHRYALEEFGLQRDAILRRLERYLDSFPIRQ